MDTKEAVAWSHNDAVAADKEGWNVMECFGAEEPYRLERMDEAAIFETDQKAWVHVAALAAKGSPLHVRALAFLRNASPAEHAAILRATGGK